MSAGPARTDVWVTRPARVAVLMAAELAAAVETQSGKRVTIEAAIVQRVPCESRGKRLGTASLWPSLFARLGTAIPPRTTQDGSGLDTATLIWLGRLALG